MLVPGSVHMQLSKIEVTMHWSLEGSAEPTTQVKFNEQSYGFSEINHAIHAIRIHMLLGGYPILHFLPNNHGSVQAMGVSPRVGNPGAVSRPVQPDPGRSENSRSGVANNTMGVQTPKKLPPKHDKKKPDWFSNWHHEISSNIGIWYPPVICSHDGFSQAGSASQDLPELCVIDRAWRWKKLRSDKRWWKVPKRYEHGIKYILK